MQLLVNLRSAALHNETAHPAHRLHEYEHPHQEASRRLAPVHKCDGHQDEHVVQRAPQQLSPVDQTRPVSSDQR